MSGGIQGLRGSGVWVLHARPWLQAHFPGEDDDASHAANPTEVQTRYDIMP